MVEIKDFFAFYTSEMLVSSQIGIKSFWVTRTFDDKSCANFAECEQGPVYGIEGDIGTCFFDFLMKLFGGGVLGGF